MHESEATNRAARARALQPAQGRSVRGALPLVELMPGASLGWGLLGSAETDLLESHELGPLAIYPANRAAFPGFP